MKVKVIITEIYECEYKNNMTESDIISLIGEYGTPYNAKLIDANIAIEKE